MVQGLSLNSDSPGSVNGGPNEAMFRSAPMTLVQFYVTIELARDVVCTLGRLGNVHFRDLNSKLTPFQRTFVSELRNIDSQESQLNFLHSIMVKYDTIKSDIFVNLKADLNPLPSSSEMDEIRSKIQTFYDRIKHLDHSFTILDQQKLKLVENRYVLTALSQFHSSSLLGFDDNYGSSGRGGGGDRDDEFNDDNDDVALLNNRNNSLEMGSETVNLSESGFNSISGTIARDKVPLLRKILWRTLRGNLYFHDSPIDEPLSNYNERDAELIDKNAFIIYIHGDFLRTRVRKIIQSLDGIIYDNVGGNEQQRVACMEDLNSKIGDFDNVVASTKNQLIAELMIFQEGYPDFCYIIQREKLIYQTLNKFDEDSTRRCLVGEGWIPVSDLAGIKQTLRHLVRNKSRNNGSGSGSESQESILITDDQNQNQNQSSSGGGLTDDPLFAIDDTDHEISSFEDDDEYGTLIAVVNELATNRTPPTFHRTNKFTAAFQSIIDAYGISTYQEVNPGLATVVTFPFMFAIMFGDLGHGFIVLLGALFLIRNEVKFSSMRNKDEIFEMAFNGRYIILLMGIFSMYTGLIYNDIFSKSMTLFKSGWDWKFPEGYDFNTDGPISITATKKSGTYPIGLDWAWHGAENSLLFTNSYKMKLSILMGFVHMNYSLFFSLVNYRYFKSRVDIIGNFIPGFLFMQSIFGYLCLTIVYKWSVDWLGNNRQPPGLLNMLINMFLSPGKIDVQLFPGQKYIQIFLVLIAAICVPWLLVYKPYTLKRENEKAIQLGYRDLNSLVNHSLQVLEEETAFDLDAELNNDPPDEVDGLNDDFNFPNDIEPLHHNSTSHGDDHDSFNFGDIVIHQVIHTIEFCLNCVSHTASYLRLWALSLAHAQLSSVLWTMTISNAFGVTGKFGIFMTVVLFAMWFSLTVCILVLMEGTSAMLHSLRLHWVEAMSKFFEGEGYAYEPFAFKEIDL